jgi:hypothetical protein
MSLQVVSVPVPVFVPCAGQVWSKRAARPEYPHERPARWPLHQGIPPSRDPEVRRMVEDARRLIAEHRRSPDFARRGRPAGL